MNLRLDYLKILKIAEEAKRTQNLKLQTLVEIVGYIFIDTNIFAAFVREGLELKDNKEANKVINETMLGGTDVEDIQKDILKYLISVNFYAKELQKILDALENNLEVPVVEQ